ELRTPLSSIIGFAELLLDSHEGSHINEEKRRLFLQEIFDRGEALERMIDDFLDVSRIENGLPLSLNKEETDLIGLLKKTVELSQTREKGYLFKLRLPQQPANTIIDIDPHRISQVLDNLFNNAVKYSSAGSTIAISAEYCQEGWYISVEDQGIGMSQQEIARVFDRFYRAESSATNVKGLGLGMSIVKSIVEAHGGHIHAESVVGSGSKFTFLIPR
nr:HAMP domain-containing histidine kinase [Gammaproteobacteria bacterium]NIR94936.1 HAMP domain-containing histidine kinase [Gammaproteobacteria bacterium]NIW45530.1 GHKL domain-containing protein [Gammaproteobacteria bacterium]NIX55690.1 GHKL domain-containing protein [candidate division Zixibacteria bacterium]